MVSATVGKKNGIPIYGHVCITYVGKAVGVNDRICQIVHGFRKNVLGGIDVISSSRFFNLFCGFQCLCQCLAAFFGIIRQFDGFCLFNQLLQFIIGSLFRCGDGQIFIGHFSVPQAEANPAGIEIGTNGFKSMLDHLGTINGDSHRFPLFSNGDGMVLTIIDWRR